MTEPTDKPAVAKKAAPARRTGKAAAQEDAQEAVEAPRSVWEALAAPFPQEDLERLPKPLSRDDRNKGRCEDLGDRPNPYSADGFYCGGWHARSVHLTYVGHAGITTRLNQVLTPGGWQFGPLAQTQEGLPFMARGEFWATLTIKDPDTGEAVSKTDLAANFNSTQEAWGDALRRCAMRFGVGTYLWSKSEAAHAQAQYAEPLPEQPPAEQRSQAQPPQQQPEAQSQAAPALKPHQAILQDRLGALGPDATAEIRAWWGEQNLPFLKDMDEWEAQAVMTYLDEREAGTPQDPS